MDNLVIFVHGTWVHSWVLFDKFYENRIRDLFREAGPNEVTFKDFRWNGHNSMSGRSKAAIELNSLVSDFLSKPEAERVVIIAHSHGGNVALQSLIGLAFDKPINLFCVATPFIFPMRRLKEDIGITSAVGIAALIAAIWSLPTNPHKSGICILVFSICMFLFGMGGGASKDYAEKKIAQIHLPTKENLRQTTLHVYKTLGDEVTAALAASQLARILFRRLVYLVHGTQRLAESAFGLLFGWMVFIYFLPRIRIWLWPSIPGVFDRFENLLLGQYKAYGLIIWYFFPFFAACLLFSIYAILVASLVLAIVITSSITFGFDAGIVALHCEMGVADAPPGTSTLRIVDLTANETDKLDHTAIYGMQFRHILLCDVRETLGLTPGKP